MSFPQYTRYLGKSPRRPSLHSFRSWPPSPSPPLPPPMVSYTYPTDIVDSMTPNDLRDVPLGSPKSQTFPRDYSPWSTPSTRSSRNGSIKEEKENEKSGSQDPLDQIHPSDETESAEYPTTWKLITILLGVGLSIFLVSLDMVYTD